MDYGLQSVADVAVAADAAVFKIHQGLAVFFLDVF